MILTQIQEIDQMVEQSLAHTTALVSLDMNDYATLKNSSSQIKAVKVVGDSWNEELNSALVGELAQAGCDKVKMLMLGITVREDLESVGYGQVMELLKAVGSGNNYNIMWGVSENPENTDNVSIMAVIGYQE